MTNGPADLEEAITLGRAALDLHPPDHSYRAVTLNNLGGYLGDRFIKFGENADLEEAISRGIEPSSCGSS